MRWKGTRVRRFGWMTDIHLNFLEPLQLRGFLDTVRAAAPDGLLICGDIAEAPTLSGFLRDLESALDVPIYFVLGNHDFYRGGIDRVREEMRALSAASRHLRWLGDGAVFPLSRDTAVIGHDGWGDARNGNAEGSPVLLSDFFLIADLAGLETAARVEKLRSLGEEAARSLERSLPAALDAFEHVILLTHVPPFPESCLYDGKPAHEDYLPYFSCKATGDAILRIAQRYPGRRLTVLCGHTHAACTVRPASNLLVKTGQAEYGAPQLQELLSV